MQQLLPEGYDIAEDVQPTILFEVMNLRNLPWLAGRGTRLKRNLPRYMSDTGLTFSLIHIKDTILGGSTRMTSSVDAPLMLSEPHTCWFSSSRSPIPSLLDEKSLVLGESDDSNAASHSSDLDSRTLYDLKSKLWAELPDPKEEDGKLIHTAVSALR